MNEQAMTRGSSWDAESYGKKGKSSKVDARLMPNAFPIWHISYRLSSSTPVRRKIFSNPPHPHFDDHESVKSSLRKTPKFMPIPTHINRKSYEKYSGQPYVHILWKKSLPGAWEGWWEDKWEINEKVNEGDDEGVMREILRWLMRR